MGEKPTYVKLHLSEGSIEKTVKTEMAYKVSECPSIDAHLYKRVKYVICDLHADRVDVHAQGRYVNLKDNLTSSSLSLWEKTKLIFSLLNHIFDKNYWQNHVEKVNYISEDDKSIIELRSLVNEYNSLLQQAKLIDGKRLTSEETKEIKTTEDNLAKLVSEIENKKK